MTFANRREFLRASGAVALSAAVPADRGADHAFYYGRARVLLPFRTGARTYLGETVFRY